MGGVEGPPTSAGFCAERLAHPLFESGFPSQMDEKEGYWRSFDSAHASPLRSG
jgi:hypothetical protein